MRLMQTALGAVISGSTIASAVCGPNSFTPNDLDIYTPAGNGHCATQFLKRGGAYSVVACSSEYDFAAGIGKVWTLCHRVTTMKINIIESLTPYAIDAILHFHSSCLFGAWTARGWWHGYLRLTANGHTITTPTRMPLHAVLDHHIRVWKILRKYHGRGFEFWLDEYKVKHVCGVDINCPATVRHTNDEGCIFVPFPSWALDVDAEDIPTTSWTLQGGGCSPDVRRSDGPMSN
ncbi:hypothetical protein C8R47DRAFT_959906 [Mycena vitilis]|nr:hypothetical protein C8R47DRAFT_959906 [Mycena vitilis]